MYQFQSRVRYSQLDSSGRLSLPALLDYFQDCSIFHSEELKLGVGYLTEKQLLWAMSSWQIVIRRYPHLCENITIGTAPYEFRGFIGCRNFWMLDEKGEEIAVANSIWSLIDTASGRPCKPPVEMLEGYKLSPKREMEYAQRRIQFEGQGVKADEILVKSHHLDTNMHVNNGQYVRIAMDYLPSDFAIAQLRAEYKMQAVLGTLMQPLIFEGENKYGISLCNEQGDAYCNVEFTSMGEKE